MTILLSSGMLFQVYQKDPLYIILYTHYMWFGLKIVIELYADNATFPARIPSLKLRSEISESLTKDLALIKIIFRIVKFGYIYHMLRENRV